MKHHFWQQRPLALKLTFLITTIVVLVVAIITTLAVRRERQTFGSELEQQAVLLLNTLSASGADSLYLEDADYLADLMRSLGEFDVIMFGRYYDAEGRIVADAIDESTRFSVEPNSFGKILLSTGNPVFSWQNDQLLAGQRVEVGNNVVGAVSVGLPIDSLEGKITAVRVQGALVATAVVLIGMVFALFVSRSITEPLKQMIEATEDVRAGDLTRRVEIHTGDELEALGDHFNLMADQLETTLHQMEDEIEERKKAQAELQQAKESAESASRAKSTFLANMSHELRTPLNAILGFAQLMLRRNTVSDKDRNNLEIIIQSGEHLLTLINQVLDMSKIEAGRMTVRETEFNLLRMLEDLESMFRLRADEKAVDFVVEVAPDVPVFVFSDEIKLRQILINLLNNALKFTDSGRVLLQVRYESGTAVSKAPVHLLHFTVEDSGPGIHPEEMDKVFEAFVRARAGVQSGEGTGLGLSLSRQFARLMGGDMTVRNVRNELGHGAIFEFSLRIKPVEVAEVEMPEHPPEIVGLAPHQPEVKVLVVDDSWENRQVLVEMLRPLGFVIKEANDGKEAVELWRTWLPDLILMDMQMPVMNGFDATQTILKNADGAAPVIIAVTASAFSQEREKILELGCRDFIRKPVQTRTILDSIQKHLAVEYIYQESEEVQLAKIPAAEAVMPGELPSNLMKRLEKAASEADMNAVESCIDEVEQIDLELAEKLKRLADEFEYGKILARLQKMETQA